jgi:hypothetical protein
MGLSLSIEALLLSWFVPSVPLFTLVVDSILKQNTVMRQRSRLRAVLEQALAAGTPASQGAPDVLATSRQVQDGIFLTRSSHARVPHLLYLAFRSRDERDFKREVENFSPSLPGGA